MNKDLGSMGNPQKVNVDGKSIYICCAGCAKKLLADPEKYLALLADRGIEPLTLSSGQLSQDNDHYEFRTIMRSNRFKALLLFLLIFGSFANAKIAIADELKQPNILFCFADDWGWPHAGAYGDPVVRTPAFDRLAREGVLVTNTFISSPSCTPSRYAVLTGLLFLRLAVGANMYGALDVQQPTFVRLLQKAGYLTGHWRKAWGPGNFTQGGYDSHPCGESQSFTEFMAKRESDRPFCFWFGTSIPIAPTKRERKKEG